MATAFACTKHWFLKDPFNYHEDTGSWNALISLETKQLYSLIVYRMLCRETGFIKKKYTKEQRH